MLCFSSNSASGQDISLWAVYNHRDTNPKAAYACTQCLYTMCVVYTIVHSVYTLTLHRSHMYRNHHTLLSKACWYLHLLALYVCYVCECFQSACQTHTHFVSISVLHTEHYGVDVMLFVLSAFVLWMMKTFTLTPTNR